MKIWPTNFEIRAAESRPKHLSASATAERHSELFAAQNLAALEAAASLWASAFQGARVSPKTKAVSPRWLAVVGRDLCSAGEHASLLEVVGSDFLLTPATIVEQSSTHYQLTVTRSPSELEEVSASSADVVHLVRGATSSRPSRGVAAMEHARSTRDMLAAHLEASLGDELKVRSARILSLLADPENLTQVARSVARGGLVAHGFGQGPTGLAEQTPASRFALQKVGPAPDPALITLRAQVNDELLAASGVPPVLLSSSATGQSQREAARRFRQYAAQPALDALTAELAVKLEIDTLRITVAENAEEIRARAGALKTLVDAGISLLEARTLAGF